MPSKAAFARALAVVVLTLGLAPLPVQAAGRAISGVVFYDRNDNGVRDPGEPGVPGIRVRQGAGFGATTTDRAGAYRLTGLPATGRVLVETGWLRSQCPPATRPAAITCAAGPGRDNAFEVDNQFIGYPLSRGSRAGVNVGLLPDWPGTTLVPPGARGPVPANPVDVAARMTWTAGTCVGGDLNICRRGDRFQLAAQIYNQGTRALTGIRGVLTVPAGDCMTGLDLVRAATAPAAGPVTAGRFDCGTRTVAVALAGSLGPGGAARIAVTGATVGGPGTPGCRVGAVDQRSCRVAEPQGRAWLFAITHIDQAGDPDSTFCAAVDPRVCPTGVHDKRRAPDEVDPVGHNVDAALGGTTSYNLQAHLLVRGPARTVPRGGVVSLRAWASNAVGAAGANQAPPGSSVTLYLPPGSGITSAPARHYLLYCSTGSVPAGPWVTCTYRGPLSPQLAGVAIDVGVAVPATWRPGRAFPVVACVRPPAGAARETNPAVRCGPGTDATRTGSDNDADRKLPVG